MASSDCLFTLPLAHLGGQQTMSAVALARSQRCCSVNNMVRAVDDGQPALPDARAGRFGSRADALRGVGSSLSDPCRGANGGRDVGHGSLALPPQLSGGRGAGRLPPLVLASTRREKANSAGPRSCQRVLLSADPKKAASKKKPRRKGRAHCYFAIPAENEFASPRAGTRPASVIFCSPRAGCRARALWARTTDCGRAT